MGKHENSISPLSHKKKEGNFMTDQTYILYNPFAGNGAGKQEAELLTVMYPDAKLYDMTEISAYSEFFEKIDPDNPVILCGGDGTLNRFINDTDCISIKNDLYFLSTGSGNDFVRDIGKEKGGSPTFRINRYLCNLPCVEINGKTTRFLNGIGYGIDGYCCEEGDRLRGQTEKPVNYTSIAIKGLLFHFQPRSAVITVDGKQHTYNKVWLAPTMNGRYYGGGMMVAPNQQRLGGKGKVSVVVLHDSSKLKTLCVFPSIFKGEHIKHKKIVDVFTGQDIRVEFDRPTPLQIDGETIRNVTSYRVMSAAALAYEKKREKKSRC